MEQKTVQTTCCDKSQPHELRLNGEFVDMEIIAGSETYRVHQVIMAGKSDYFRAIMSSQLREAREKRVTFEDLDPEIMRTVIEFCYTNQVPLNDDNFDQVLSAAFRFCIESLKGACIKFIESRITASNCIRLIHSFQQYNLEQLVDKAIGSCLENFDRVCETPEFFDIEEDLLEILLPDERLNLSESGIFRALFKWTEHDSENRKAAFERLVKHVRLGTISARELSELGSFELATMSVWLCKEIVAKVKCYLEIEGKNKLSEDEPLAEVSATPRRNLRNCQRMYAIGGIGYSQAEPSGSAKRSLRTLTSVEIYNPITNQWTEAASMCSRAANFGCAVLGDHIYVAGGSDEDRTLNTFQRYSIADNTWQSLPEMSKPRKYVGLVALGEYLYAIGGSDGHNSVDMVERFCPGDMKWHSCATLLNSCYHTVYVALDKYIYAIECSQYNDSTKLRRYDPKTDSWSPLSTLTRKICRLQCTCYNGEFIIMCWDKHFLPHLEIIGYNPSRDSWYELPRRQIDRRHSRFFEFGRELYAVAWQPSYFARDFLESYNPETKQWTARTGMITGRAEHGLIVHPQRDYPDENILVSLLMKYTQ